MGLAGGAAEVEAWSINLAVSVVSAIRPGSRRLLRGVPVGGVSRSRHAGREWHDRIFPSFHERGPDVRGSTTLRRALGGPIALTGRSRALRDCRLLKTGRSWSEDAGAALIWVSDPANGRARLSAFRAVA
jgi:hypothetical protein